MTPLSSGTSGVVAYAIKRRNAPDDINIINIIIKEFECVECI
jgi:hypothetical protein